MTIYIYIYIYIYIIKQIYIYIWISGQKKSTTQSAQISQKQDRVIYMQSWKPFCKMLYCLPVAVACNFWRANESRLMETLLIHRGPPGSKSVTTLIYGEWSYMDIFINMS